MFEPTLYLGGLCWRRSWRVGGTTETPLGGYRLNGDGCPHGAEHGAQSWWRPGAGGAPVLVSGASWVLADLAGGGRFGAALPGAAWPASSVGLPADACRMLSPLLIESVNMALPPGWLRRCFEPELRGSERRGVGWSLAGFSMPGGCGCQIRLSIIDSANSRALPARGRQALAVPVWALSASRRPAIWTVPSGSIATGGDDFSAPADAGVSHLKGAEPSRLVAVVAPSLPDKSAAPRLAREPAGVVVPLRRPEPAAAGDESELEALFTALWSRIGAERIGHLPPVGLNFAGGITNRFGERVVPADSLPQEKVFHRSVELVSLAPYGPDTRAFPATRLLVLNSAGAQRQLPLQLEDTHPSWPVELRLRQRSYLLINRRDLAEATSAADLLRRCRWGCNTLIRRWREEIRALFADLIEQSENSSAAAAVALAQRLEHSAAPAVELVIGERRQRALLGRLGMTPANLEPLLDPEAVYPIFNCSYADWQFACIWLHLQPLTTTLSARGAARTWQALPRQPFHVLERRLALAFGILVRPEIQQLWDSRQCLLEQGIDLPFMDHALLMAKLRARVAKAINAGEVQHPALLAAFDSLGR